MLKPYISFGLTGLTIFSGLILSSSFVSADDTIIDDVSIAVPVSCTMLGTGTNSHTANVPNGTYLADIGTTTLKIYCNDSTGFAVYAIGFTGDEYSGADHTKLIGVTNNQKISTGTATSGNTSNWAMKLETSSNATYPITLDNGYGSYSQVPDTYTKVAHRDSGTDTGTSATGAELTTTYASYMSSSQIADTYSGKVKYTLVHPANETPLQPQITESGKICYYPNGNDVEGTMGCQTISASATSATLLASNFSRSGYGFAGWSTTFDYSDNTGFLGPQEDITFTAGQYTGSNPGLSLYAHWIKSAGNLQGWTCPNNATMPVGTVTALADQRDNNTYAIAKLADDNCWMIESLRLENTAEHNSDGSLAQGYGTSSTYGDFSGLAYPESGNFSSTYSANSLYNNVGGDGMVNIGTSDYPAQRMPRYNNINSNAHVNNPTVNTVPMYSYGNYYTWAAAIADTTYYPSGDQNMTSLCPSGWKLPIGSQSVANSSFGQLSVSLSGPEGGATATYNTTPNGTAMSKIFRSYPNNFLYSGYFGDSATSNVGYYGVYWSSTAYNTYHSFYLFLNSSEVSPGNSYNSKVYGNSIRCLASSL